MKSKEEIANQLVAALMDQGQLIQGGWEGMMMMCGLTNASELQESEMRKAFFMGAQHLFASIVTGLSPESETTEQDLKRMDSIHRELEEFRRSLDAPVTSPLQDN